MFWRHTVIAVGLLLLLRNTQCAEVKQSQAEDCPGVESGECGQACRVAVCQALVNFYRSTHNASQPWVNNSGWDKTDSLSCEELTAPQLNSTAVPDYCSWHGVACCTPAGPGRPHELDSLLHPCSPSWSVKGLDLQVNNLNGSVDNPRFVDSLLQLHACGLFRLQLQGNGLSGRLAAPDWGAMTNMIDVDLAANWITGTLPGWLRNLTQLQRLSLGSNQLQGTMPAWIGDELPRLEVLSLGVNTGVSSDGVQGLSGSIPDSLGRLSSLEVLNLELNALAGVLPAGLCGPGSLLRALKLRGNRLEGSIEPLVRCSELTQLDISSNNFSGPFTGPRAAGAWPQLAVLDASSNGFDGPLPQWVYQLPMLEFLNLANNRFSGRIRRHIMLSTYLKEINLENNQLSGPIDDSLWMLPHLRLVDLSHNRLNGSISGMIGRTSSLEVLQLGANALTGPLPPQLGLLKKISLVSTAQNPLLSCLVPPQRSTPTAAAPAAPAAAAASPNSSAGSGSFGAVKLADGPQAEPLKVRQPKPACAEQQLLPCFLYFANYTVPRTDKSRMACPAILRRHIDEARSVCDGNAAGQLGGQSQNVADALAPDAQSWKIEPGYYQYRGCRCFSGFVEVWLEGGSLLSCEPEAPPRQPPWVRGLIQALSASGAMLLAAVGLLVWLRMAVALRPRWRREQELAERRQKGVPCGAPATIVVTDIEAYSELMASNAPLTTKALGMHNAILRRAASAHAGHVIEQEGDSWSVAFHSAMDAAAFCLQVQQALNKTSWPRHLGSHLASSSTPQLSFAAEVPEAAAAAAAGRAASGQQPWAVQLGRCSFTSSSSNTAAPGSASPARLLKHGIPAGWGRPTDRHKDREGSNIAAVGHRKSAPSAAQVCGCEAVFAALSGSYVAGQQRGSRSSSSSSSGSSSSSCLGHAAAPEAAVHGHVSSSSCSASSMLLESGSRVAGPDDVGDQTPPAKMRLNSNGGSRSSRLLSMIGLGLQGSATMAGRAGAEAVQQGLRVRMGVASGVVPADVNISNCSLLQLAKAVSDMAHGGQILLDARCCAGVRDRLTELGAVDAAGYHDMQLANAARAAMRQQTSGVLGYCLGRFSICLACSLLGSQASQLDSDTLLLDMGEYYCPALAPIVPAANSYSSSRRGCDGSEGTTGVGRIVAAAGPGRAAMAAAAGAALSGMSSKADVKGGAAGGQLVPATLQLYSITARALACQATQWRGALNFKQSSEMVARSFFHAPGADAAELQQAQQHGASSPCRALGMPLAVTLVFCCVEGGAARLHRQPEVARLLHSSLSRLMQALLLALPCRESRPDGYLARQLEGELKFMLAFHSPARALEWALLLQEVMLHVPWPAPVLEAFALSCSNSTHVRSELRACTSSSGQGGSCCSGGSNSGRPQLNVGLAEGQPQCIGPDHLGRADYHAPFVNLAARMLAAAHGGQVVTSIELAQSIFSAWCYEAELTKCSQAPDRAPAKHSRPIHGYDAGAAAPGFQQQQQDDQDQQPRISSGCLAQQHEVPFGDVQQQLGDLQQQVQPHILQQQQVQPQIVQQQHVQPQVAAASSPVAWPPSSTMRLTSCGSSSSVAARHPDQRRHQHLPIPQAAWDGLLPAGSCQKLAAHWQQLKGALLPPAAYPVQQVRVSGWHTGCYAFKGCGVIDMVAFTCQGAAGQHVRQDSMQQQQQQPQGGTVQQLLGKSMLLVQRSGPVVGLQNCPVLLPDVLPVLQKVWDVAAEVAAHTRSGSNS